MLDLYRRDVEISQIHRVLSIGMLGLQKNRRLVPTRWSISATDDTISAYLTKSLTSNAKIDFFEVYKYSHLGNYYSVILIPDEVWSFEMKEVWIDDNGNLEMGLDFEDAKGLDHYPVIAGAYFAARLAVAEHLARRRKNAAALVLREIHSDYVMPVGVWQVREGIREALKSKKRVLEGFEEALSFAFRNLSAPKEYWIKDSRIFEHKKKQLRMTDFLGKPKEN